jgi:DNA-binding CsgD family transcriptional regulator
MFWKNHRVILWMGVLTAMTIILFRAVSLLVIYRYLKLDFYLCLVAVFFLVTGILLSSRYKKANSHLPARNSPMELLSKQETVVLQMVAEGKTNKEIANALFIEISTVKTHINHIYSKMLVSNRREVRMKYSEWMVK